LLAAAGVLVGSGTLRKVIPPLWSAYPTLGSQRAGSRAEACTLPLLRSDVAARLHSAAVPGWLLAFLQLLAEGARAAMRELDRLLDVAEQGRGLIARCDRRARLPAVIDAVLRSPVLTPKGLAAELAITPQTATALLRELRAAKLVTEITGRRSFRAFAIMAK
jgi:CRP-like cAMP-binding protein